MAIPTNGQTGDWGGIMAVGHAHGVNEWKNEWMNGWMNEWMNEWMNQSINQYQFSKLSPNDNSWACNFIGDTCLVIWTWSCYVTCCMLLISSYCCDALLRAAVTSGEVKVTTGDVQPWSSHCRHHHCRGHWLGQTTIRIVIQRRTLTDQIILCTFWQVLLISQCKIEKYISNTFTIQMVSCIIWYLLTL